jgi:hypothetical protein
VCESLWTTKDLFGATVLSLGTLLIEVLGGNVACDLCRRRTSHGSPYWQLSRPWSGVHLRNSHRVLPWDRIVVQQRRPSAGLADWNQDFARN